MASFASPSVTPCPGAELQDLGELRICPRYARLGHGIGRHGGGEGVFPHGQPAAQGIVPLHRPSGRRPVATRPV